MSDTVFSLRSKIDTLETDFQDTCSQWGAKYGGIFARYELGNKVLYGEHFDVTFPSRVVITKAIKAELFQEATRIFGKPLEVRNTPLTHGLTFIYEY